VTEPVPGDAGLCVLFSDPFTVTDPLAGVYGICVVFSEPLMVTEPVPGVLADGFGPISEIDWSHPRPVPMPLVTGARLSVTPFPNDAEVIIANAL
jgi:hypothetical protein